MADLYKYGTAVHLRKPMIKRGVVDFALSADWTPVAGDVKISIDGGAAANVTNLPTAITMGNTAEWDFSLTSGELTGKQIRITVADSATKAVEDNAFEIDTYGNASAQHVADFSQAYISPGTGTGQLNVSSGRGDANLLAQGGVAFITGTARSDTTNTVSGIALPATWDTDKVTPGDVIVILAGTSAGSSGIVNSTTGMGGSTPSCTVADQWSRGIAPGSDSIIWVWKNGGGLIPIDGSTIASATQLGAVQSITTNINTELGTPATTVSADIAAISARLPAALTAGGKMDSNISTITTGVLTGAAFADGFLTAAKIAANALGASQLGTDAVTEIVNAIYAQVIEGTTTFLQGQRIHNSVLAGKATGLDIGQPHYRDLADTKDVVVANTDESGNRSTVTLNVS